MGGDFGPQEQSKQGDVEGRYFYGRYVYLRDVGAGLLSSLICSPFVTIVDRAITENASGRATLVTSATNGIKELCLSPLTFWRRPEAFMLFGVYGVTQVVLYVTANVTDSYGRLHPTLPESQKQLVKFSATTLVNCSATLLKDRAFTKMFASKAQVTKLPIASNFLFLMRDGLTVAAGVTLPSLVADNYATLGIEFIGKETAITATQIASPLLVQWVSTPLYLLALDLYNREQVSANDRLAFIRREYLKTVIARMSRIFPAYSIGMNLNRKLRGF